VNDVEPLNTPILMKHLLSHSSGLSYGFIEPESVIDQAYLAAGVFPLGEVDMTLEGLCEGLSTLPLAYQPGSSWRYSFATDVTARVVEVLGRASFDDFLKANLFDPLGMADTDFHVPKAKEDRFTTMYAPVDLLDPMKPGLTKADDPTSGQYTRPPRFLSGGGGLVSTVQDYLAFIRMIVSQGEWNGARILKPETVALMRTNQLAPGVGVQFPMWEMPGTVFGLGLALKASVTADEPSAALGECHWGGLAGTHSWMAPAANLTGICMTQRMPGFWHPFSQEFKSRAYSLAAQT
jgi:CubicO group peptidase (beta-lactamase class C family)